MEYNDLDHALGHQEATMRRQIQSLQEERATAMKEEISRLEMENKLQASKYELLEAQLQQAGQQAAILERQITKLNKEIDGHRDKVERTEQAARQDRLLFDDAQSQLKEAISRNGALMLKLKKAETARDELQRAARDQTLQQRQGEECTCTTCSRHGKILKAETAAVSQVKTIEGQVRGLREEISQCRTWAQGKLNSLEEDLEGAKIIYSLHNSLSMQKDSFQRIQDSLMRRNEQLALAQQENKKLSSLLERYEGKERRRKD